MSITLGEIEVLVDGNLCIGKGDSLSFKNRYAWAVLLKNGGISPTVWPGEYVFRVLLTPRGFKYTLLPNV